MLPRVNYRGFAASLLAAAALAVCLTPAQAQTPSGQPITIGFGMALTGPLAANGKQALLGMQIWEEEINAKGGLLGRPVKLIYYDDQIQSIDRTGHLHQAAQRRQGRPGGRSATPPTWLRPPCRW